MSLPSGFGPTERRERLFAPLDLLSLLESLTSHSGTAFRCAASTSIVLDLRQPAQQPDRRLDGGADAGCLGIGAEAGERWYPG